MSWSEAVELVEHLGEVQSHGNDEFVFVVNGQSVFFKKPHTHDLGVEEVSRLPSSTTTPPMFITISVEVVRQTSTRCSLTILIISVIN
ncbi:MAG: hypothetical protein WA510_23760 [Acidobacteriaceae bacterium]